MLQCVIASVILHLSERNSIMSKEAYNLLYKLTLLTPIAIASAGSHGWEPPRVDHTAPNVCYGKVKIDAKWAIKKERHLVSPESKTAVNIPARYEWTNKTVVVKPAFVKHIKVAPVYKTVWDNVVVVPQRSKQECKAAQWAWREKKVLVKKAHKVWKKQYKDPTKVQSHSGKPTGEVMCVVDVPAVWNTVKEKYLQSPRKCWNRVIPPVYSKRERKVVEKPAYTRTVPVPAVTKVVEYKKLVEAARTKYLVKPPVYKWVEKKYVTAPESYRWQKVNCVDQS